jgi:hypothetical protein
MVSTYLQLKKVTTSLNLVLVTEAISDPQWHWIEKSHELASVVIDWLTEIFKIS